MMDAIYLVMGKIIITIILIIIGLIIGLFVWIALALLGEIIKLCPGWLQDTIMVIIIIIIGYLIYIRL